MSGGGSVLDAMVQSELPAGDPTGGDDSGRKCLNNNTIELPEYIVDPTTKTTYLKGKFLGKGGFARAHEVTDLTSNRIYAGKIIPKTRLTKHHQKEKILREIELHKSLHHRNIVRFHHFFEDSDYVYIILEYCSRKSLVHMLRHRKALTEQEVRYFMYQLAQGVQYIHNQRVIHRDLKLGNMFLSEDMEVKIGDFGLATKDTTLGRVTVCGTPNYIAPEVLNMEGHGPSADIWAMGCIMYAMLVGQPPFETTTLNETYSRITSNKYSIPPNISQSARSLISSMLQPRPEDRPNISQVLQHKFFTAGYMPKVLSAACCTTAPKFPAITIITKQQLEPHVLGQEIKKMTNAVSTLKVTCHTKAETVKLKNEENHKKDCGFTFVLRQKLTSVLGCDKAKKNRGCNILEIYNMIQSCLNSTPSAFTDDPPALGGPCALFVTKWIDYSNKYGFGFQLSDNSVGVLFNDATRIGLWPDRTKIEYQDVVGKPSTYNVAAVPCHLGPKLTLLKYFAQYMEEKLTEGGNLQDGDLVRPKGSLFHVHQWRRTSRCIVMQMSTGTVQVNFFKDHTKLVVTSDGILTYINEDRQSASYCLLDLARHGCSAEIQSRMHLALSALDEFFQLESTCQPA